MATLSTNLNQLIVFHIRGYTRNNLEPKSCLFSSPVQLLGDRYTPGDSLDMAIRMHGTCICKSDGQAPAPPQLQPQSPQEIEQQNKQ